MEIQITLSQYEKIREQSLFFLKYNEYITYDKNGEEIDNSTWRSIDSDLGFNIPVKIFGQNEIEFEYCLCIVEKIEEFEKNNTMLLYFHEAAFNKKDFSIIFDDCIARSNDKDDKYFFVSLLWFLDKKNINKEVFIQTIQRYDSRYIPFILNILRKIFYCLSILKQNTIKEIFEHLGGEYKIYMPKMIIDAIQILNNQEYDTIEINKFNIFQLVNIIIGYDTTSLPIIECTKDNILLNFRKWVHSDEPLENYSVLKSLFPMVAEPIRLEIVKRYFHDIRIGNTTFDHNLLYQFKNNQFDDFIRFRYSVETPSDQIILTVPLLCDSILTLYNSKGNSFQTFDGVLDFIITHCDKKHPQINPKLYQFIPVCNNGVIYNKQFKGFIDYQIIRKFNKDKMSDNNLLNFIRIILDQYGTRQKYPICKHNNNIKLDDEQLLKCTLLHSLEQYKSYKLDCFGYKEYENKWLVDSKHINILNTFLQKKLEIDNNIDCYINIDIDMVSIDMFREYIYSLSLKFTNINDSEFIVPSYNEKEKTYELWLINQFTDILKMRIFPQKGAMIGNKFDIFNYKKEINFQSYNQDNKTYKEQIAALKQKESEEVTNRTIESLKKEFNVNDYNGSYFELQYNRETLIKIINKYYFQKSFSDNDDDILHEFLTKESTSNGFKPFCAPKLSEVNNPAIDIPYFWCRGKECFRNNLNNQTITETNDWQNYSLYHLIEIIGYPKLHKTIAGYEPDPIIWNFIAITNKVIQKFKRLKCRSCGHLMFTDKSSGFNRYNYYSCINPNCPKVNKPVYLNYCYKCKKGIIDSRDSKQCPNGWYICPTCASCCDDNQYERQAQRYILSNRPIPNRIKKMLGHGHNDKDEYFCPNCGNKLEITKDTCNKTIKKCPICHKSFSLQEEYQDEM